MIAVITTTAGRHAPRGLAGRRQPDQNEADHDADRQRRQRHVARQRDDRRPPTAPCSKTRPEIAPTAAPPPVAIALAAAKADEERPAMAGDRGDGRPPRSTQPFDAEPAGDQHRNEPLHKIEHQHGDRDFAAEHAVGVGRAGAPLPWAQIVARSEDAPRIDAPGRRAEQIGDATIKTDAGRRAALLALPPGRGNSSESGCR